MPDRVRDAHDDLVALAEGEGVEIVTGDADLLISHPGDHSTARLP